MRRWIIVAAVIAAAVGGAMPARAGHSALAGTGPGTGFNGGGECGYQVTVEGQHAGTRPGGIAYWNFAVTVQRVSGSDMYCSYFAYPTTHFCSDAMNQTPWNPQYGGEIDCGFPISLGPAPLALNPSVPFHIPGMVPIWGTLAVAKI